jgi:hypothetical protein
MKGKNMKTTRIDKRVGRAREYLIPKELKEFTEEAHAYQETTEPQRSSKFPQSRQEDWENGYWTAMNFAGEWIRFFLLGGKNK